MELKKDKMVSCGARGCANGADKNSKKTTLIATIMLIWCYNIINKNHVFL